MENIVLLLSKVVSLFHFVGLPKMVNCWFGVHMSPFFNSPHSLFPGYGIEHAQCVPPSEFSEPSFITESYQTLHPISSEELLSLKYENDYPSVILRDPLQTDTLQTDYFTIKQEVVTPDNMCMGRTSRGRSDFFSRSSWFPRIT